MSQAARFLAVYPIGDTDVGALPVKALGPAIGFYSQVLGFSVLEKAQDRARLRRDEAEIGLAVNGADPDQASCFFDVENVEALRSELEAAGIEPSKFRVDETDDGPIRLFFAKEPYGVCFCFGQPA